MENCKINPRSLDWFAYPLEGPNLHHEDEAVLREFTAGELRPDVEALQCFDRKLLRRTFLRLVGRLAEGDLEDEAVNVYLRLVQQTSKYNQKEPVHLPSSSCSSFFYQKLTERDKRALRWTKKEELKLFGNPGKV
jgi:hypothetical protein